MTGMSDDKFSSYSHGIVCQNCLAKQYSELGVTVKLIITGTFVQVLSIRDDDVLFCIVHDDMQAEVNQMVCKRADIINVPENLWGPLFTVEKATRLSLVKDSQIAESIGNISVGHTVQVLGPDNSVICIANVTFRNSIGRLGVGIYFGLQVLSPRENLSTITEKVSLLEPGTKGFPRGCDIVVTIDKILPSNSGVNRDKSVWSQDKENQKQQGKNLPCSLDNRKGTSKATAGSCLKDKISNNCKKVQCRNSPADSEGIIDNYLKKVMNSDNPLDVDDEVIYLNGDIPERGVVRWMGLIENSLKVGVELDNPVGSGRGTVEGLGELFRTKHQHALIVPPMALIKLSDYLSNTQGIHVKKKNNNNNNNSGVNNSITKTNNKSINNNNDYITSIDFGSVGQHSTEGQFKMSRKASITHQPVKCGGKLFASTHSFQPLEEEEFRAPSQKDFTRTNQTKSDVHNTCKSFDAANALQTKISSRRNCSSVDNGFAHTDTTSLNGCNLTSFPRRISPHDYSHPTQTNQQTTRTRLFSDSRPHKSPKAEHDAAFHKTSAAHTTENTLRNLHQQDGEALYDVPRADILRAPVPEDPFREDFYKGRRHTLAPAGPRLRKGTWGWEPGEPSNGDEEEEEEEEEEVEVSGYWEPWKTSELERTGCEELGKGSMVELSLKGEPHYGVIRWIGTVAESREDCPPLVMAGVEMEEECAEFTDGTLNNKRYFHCNPRKGLFVPLRKCKKDSRFVEDSHRQSLSSKVNYGQIDCPVVEGTVPPINTKDDIELICGKNRGIQGHHNSCYLDATLFSMFAFTSVFDSLLYRPPTSNDIPQYSEVQRVLREEIVNPLRKNLYVRADRVMKLRRLMEELSSISGLTSEEKDPEEFLNSLLAQILKEEPFLKLSSGQEAFHYQLFVEKDERLTLPSVQLLFEQSFVTSDIKLKQVPSCLIIQMPRFGKSFKMYSRILPPHLLDITDIIENSPRQCTVCGKLAEYECKDCFGQQGIGNGLESISFCKACLDTAHNHHCRSTHNSRALTVPVEFYELQNHCVIPRLFMELFAVVCIETSHYVAFVKCGSGSDAPWCFFDSMADRKGEQNGYNIPEMVPCPDLPYWLSEEGAKTLNEMQDERQLPEHAKRLFSDAYMCMYQSPDLMMYR